MRGRHATIDPRAGAGGPDRAQDTLEVSDLTISYLSGGYEIRPIDGLDLHVASGQLVLLLGASGCGKTTLLSALASILTPTAGTIRLGDTEVTALSGRALVDYRRHAVGIVFQTFNLVPSLTALENVIVPLRTAGIDRRAATVRATTLLDRVGLSDRLHHRPGDLSGGQAQRVAIARALALDPPLVLADEPTAHLDYIQVEAVLQLLRELAAPGRIVVVATHDERLLPLATRIVDLTPRVASHTRAPIRREIWDGELVFAQGDPGDLVYVVESGEIAIVRRRTDGGEETLAVHGPGQYFGELAPMFGLRRSAGARAHGATVVTGYPLAEFQARQGVAT